MQTLYPWELNPYHTNLNTQKEQQTFFEKLDSFVNQKQYVRITLLDWYNIPLKEIQGELTSGSITKDGSSSVRRSCNFSATVSGTTYNVDDLKMDFSINKKVFIEIGIKNLTNEYKNYDIIWFKQGIFFINSINLSTSSSTQVNIAIQLKDLMSCLNGDVGGLFTSTTILDEMDTQATDGSWITEKVKIIDIILELVNHFGGIPLDHIIIEDIPPRIQRIMKWMGSNPLWMKQLGDVDSGIYYDCTIETPDNTGTWEKFVTGDDVGYIYEDFVYTDELTMAPGDSVCTALDKIKEYLGNFEYFFDVNGYFHFREIKNYMNITQASIVGFEAKEYLTDITTGKSIFNFTDDRNLVSLTANPQYSNIKNDYVVSGVTTNSITDVSHLILYHLAIDYKPNVGNTYRNFLLYKSNIDGLIKGTFPLVVDELPEVGNFSIVYMVPNKKNQPPEEDIMMLDDDEEEEEPENKFYYWAESNEYVDLEPIIYYPQSEYTEGYVTKDWRTELYLRALLSSLTGTDTSQYYYNLQNNQIISTSGEDISRIEWLDNLYEVTKHEHIDVDSYATELLAFWPEIYDLEKQCFWAEEEDKSVLHTSLTGGNYYLDFIDPSTSNIGEFCISNIGKRSISINNDKINCLFEPQFPNIVFLDMDADDIEEKRNECILTGQPFTQVRGEIFSALAAGGNHYSCFDEIKYQLYLHTNYAKTLSIIALPAFYLEPNTRCTINDNSTNTRGDFIISNVTIPFGAGQTMSVACSEVNLDRYE